MFRCLTLFLVSDLVCINCCILCCIIASVIGLIYCTVHKWLEIHVFEVMFMIADSHIFEEKSCSCILYTVAVTHAVLLG